MSLTTHRHYRILLIDGNKYDRDLLSLALRHHLQEVDIVEASSAVGFAEQLATGSVDAVIADPRIDWSAPFELVHAVRRQNPGCVWSFFAAEAEMLPDAACIGHGIDGNFAKTSAGFLELPERIAGALRQHREGEQALGVPHAAQLSELFPLPTFMLTPRQRIIGANGAFEKLLGLPRYAFAGEEFEALLSGPEQRGRWRRLVNALDGDRAPRGGSLQLAAPGGAGRDVRVLLTPVSGRRGDESLVSGVLIDEQEFGGDRDDLLPLKLVGQDSEAGRISTVLSHDLQQPLQNIVREARWLVAEQHQLPPDCARTAAHILDSAERMQGMVDGFLAMSQLRQPGSPPGPVPLQEVLADVVDNLKIRIEEAGATVQFDALPTVSGVRTQLLQVFQNLVSNAIKFRGNRVPRVHITAQAEGETARIRVEDNGIGIRSADLPRIFDMFQRLHTEGEYPGTGIGLALCKKIIEGHDGRITVESTVGRGSVFTVELRLAGPQQNADRSGDGARRSNQ